MTDPLMEIIAEANWCLGWYRSHKKTAQKLSITVQGDPEKNHDIAKRCRKGAAENLCKFRSIIRQLKRKQNEYKRRDSWNYFNV